MKMVGIMVGVVFELFLCWGSLVHISEGTAGVFHYGVLIGVGIEGLILLLRKLRRTN